MRTQSWILALLPVLILAPRQALAGESCGDCGDCVNGFCDFDTCECDLGWTGACCDTLLICLFPCLVCTADECLECEPTYVLVNGVCEPTLGSCCQSCSCTETTPEECDALGGAFAGLGSTCLLTFCFDTVDPVVTCPPDIELCEDGETGDASATDDCDQDILIFILDDPTICLAPPGGGPNPVDPTQPCSGCTERYIVRTFTANDDALHADSCTQTIRIGDAAPPIIGNPGPIDACFEDVAAAIAAGIAAVAAVTSDNCTSDLEFTGDVVGTCAANVRVFATDECGLDSATVLLPTRIDAEPPVIGTPAPLEPCYPTLLAAREAACAATLAVATDNCDANLTCDTHYAPPEGTCEITITATITDDCDNSTDGPPLNTVVDGEIPTIECPPDIAMQRGDKICNEDVANWLDDASATDNCPGTVTITNNAAENGFECGFPPGTTTTVTFTATDPCGNIDTCTSTITVDPLHRIESTQKGSLLVFSKLEIKWDAAGNLTQDTFLDFSNDSDTGAVDVQAFLINGDRTLEEITTDDGTVIQDAEPGWNRIDCRFELTKNQPHYWSAANGSSMCGPFTSLDGDGPGRPDPEVAGGRVLRGYVVMWAVKFNGEYYDEIRWNHLKGDALIINYSEGSAWEYNAWAAQARCGAHGAPVLDCLITDANGVCCDAAPIPGNIGLDGFAYDVTYDRLLLDFYATGTTALSAIRADGSAGVGISLDTDLTLHSMDIDLRQDGEGPILSKAEFEVFNQNEVKLSGLRRCICCWDQTMFSDYVQHVGIPNYFLLGRLGTDKGQARIDAVRSVVEECNYCETCGVEPRIRRLGPTTAGIGEIIDVCQLNFSQDTALLGLSTKFVNFENGSVKIDRAGMNLVGTGEQTRVFQLDLNGEDPGVATHQTTILQYGSRIQYDVPRGTDEARQPISISAPTRETRSGKEANPAATLRGDRTGE